MTRRERHLRIIKGFPHERDYLRGVMAKLGMDAFTDEAIEMLAADMVKGWRFQQKLNRENRARMTVKASAA